MDVSSSEWEVSDSKDAPRIRLTEQEVEDGQGMASGVEVAVIEVVHHDGRISRFWVDLSITRQNRVKARLATNIGGHTRVKELTAARMARRANR